MLPYMPFGHDLGFTHLPTAVLPDPCRPRCGLSPASVEVTKAPLLPAPCGLVCRLWSTDLIVCGGFTGGADRFSQLPVDGGTIVTAPDHAPFRMSSWRAWMRVWRATPLSGVGHLGLGSRRIPNPSNCPGSYPAGTLGRGGDPRRMANLRDFVRRFRPAGAPGAAAPAGVPADRGAEQAAELAPVFEALHGANEGAALWSGTPVVRPSGAALRRRRAREGLLADARQRADVERARRRREQLTRRPASAPACSMRRGATPTRSGGGRPNGCRRSWTESSPWSVPQGWIASQHGEAGLGGRAVRARLLANRRLGSAGARRSRLRAQ